LGVVHAAGVSVEQRGRVLVFDSSPALRADIDVRLSGQGYGVETTGDAEQALEAVERFAPDVVLVELGPANKDGFEFLRLARAIRPTASYVAVAESGAIETLVEALRRGADRCLTRPVRTDALNLVVECSMEKPLQARALDGLGDEAAPLVPTRMEQIVGTHPALQRLFKRMLQAAQSRATVLIQGETGTGKELIARAVHNYSQRSHGPMVRLNCAALAESVLESELFGHEKGSFTGAASRRKGRFEQAAGGTLFLDELSEMPLSVQIKLLRFLQEREFERVGGNETLRVDVRVIAATNRHLESLVAEGRFRQDLYYRLKVVVLEVPPLRSRPSDIPVLAEHFLRQYAAENGKAIYRFASVARRALLEYPWPGNVRELQHAIEQAVVLCEGDQIELDDLPIAPPSSEFEPVKLMVPGVRLAEVERYTILKTLEAVQGSTSKAASILGISRRTIQYRLQEWGLARRAERDSVDEEPELLGVSEFPIGNG
jgi:DNA-binding NtrC family response regulator